MKYSSQGKQLILDIFSTPLEKSLDPKNRWYKLANALPWDKIERIYNSSLDNVYGGGGKRMIVGSLIIKHQMNLSDKETIDLIQENPYMQYFVGKHEFNNVPISDPSLFVYIRKRLGIDNINAITLLLMDFKGANQSKATSNKESNGDDDDFKGN